MSGLSGGHDEASKDAQPPRPGQAERKWLVLGASGQLGREWVQALEQDGEDVSGLGRRELDITREDDVRGVLAQLRPDVIVNCAAYTKVDQAEVETGLAEAVNIHAAGAVARAAAASGSLLVHYSTDYVFPGLAEHRRQYPEGYPESFPPDPVNEYGRTKWLGEQKIRALNGPHLILRTSWLCGRYGSNFVLTMLRLAAERDRLRVVNDQFGCPSFAGPVVRNTRALIEQGVRGTLHISSGGVTTWHDFAREIFRLRGLEVVLEAIPTSGYPTPANRPKWSRLDIRQLAGVPGTRILPWQDELELFLRDLS
jgi:dTDP-4-dehydrorhamnose reductase